VPVRLISLLVLPGFPLLLLWLLWSSYPVAILCARFQDLTQAVQSGLTLAFFTTPVLWKPEQIPADKHYLLSLNLLAAVLAVVREPLFGQPPALSSSATATDWVSSATMVPARQPSCA